MSYFSLNSVSKAYEYISKSTKEKFWGILSIFYSINDKVQENVLYNIDTPKLSNFLEDVFRLADKKTYDTTSAQYTVVFSKKWQEKLYDYITLTKLEILPVIIWAYRNRRFSKELSFNELVELFVNDFHLSMDIVKELFLLSSDKWKLDYTSSKYDDSSLLKTLGGNATSPTIKMNHQFVVANAGDLSRGPYFQPLYAALQTLECLILFPFDESEYYNISDKSKDSDKRHDIRYGLSLPLQQIFYGAPGTGKSLEVKKQTGEWISEDKEQDLPNVFRTTFHPDTDYASFVGCYKPTMKPTSKEEKTLTGKDEEIVYEFVPQAFTDAYVYAYNNPAEQTHLVIEEINRGNCAQIFGDLFQLLDRKGGVSEYKIKADKDLANYLLDKLGEDSEGIKDGKLCLPANLNILATMNTSDQSLFPMDSAFKRRWEWEYVPINYGTEIKSGTFEIAIGEKTYLWVDFIKETNKRIFDLTQSEDKQLGNFFIKHSVDEKEFKSKVMFYLWYEVLRDEMENNKYFFYKKAIIDDKEQTSKFYFKDLYEESSSETLQQFMDYLGVAPK